MTRHGSKRPLGTDPEVTAAQELVARRLAEHRRRGEALREYARRLDIPYATLSNWTRMLALPSDERFSDLCRHVSFTTEEQRGIRKAYVRIRSLATLYPRGLVSQANQQAATASTEHGPALTPPGSVSMEERVQRLERLIEDRLGPGGALLAGIGDEGRRSGEAFLTLTAANFQPIDASSLSAKDLQAFVHHTDAVLEEARRCLFALAQVQPDQVQKDLLHRIGDHLSELWSLYQVASSIVPKETVRLVELQRREFRRARE